MIDGPLLFFATLCFINKIHYLIVYVEYDANTLICPLASTHFPNPVAFLIIPSVPFLFILVFFFGNPSSEYSLKSLGKG